MLSLHSCFSGQGRLEGRHDGCLLPLLTRDAHMSVTDLAEKLGVSRGSVQSRVDRM
ncbi:AsnC family transcriptional regulator [Roseibium sp.]|uniref:AsnC family transcriptional regulator n=1 Tax=Roseibium sp. TaxID=1936156 RepID=UPI003BAE781A